MENIKVILISNLDTLYRLLNNHDYELSKFTIYGNKIIVKYSNIDELQIVRIWKTKSLLNYNCEDFNNNNFIASLDYTINEYNVRINYLNINEDLDSLDILRLNKALIYYVKNIAKENNKNKIKTDVHFNLKLYDKYYKNEGFKLTDHRSFENPHWIETELIIDL